MARRKLGIGREVCSPSGRKAKPSSAPFALAVQVDHVVRCCARLLLDDPSVDDPHGVPSLREDCRIEQST
jgi:hypothetical protein